MMAKINPHNAPFLAHLHDLRRRLIRSLIVVLILFGIFSFFSKDIYKLLALPLLNILPPGSHIITLHPLEAWLTYLKTAFWSALFISTPYLFFEAWQFFAPGLYQNEKKHSLRFIAMASLLFLSGAIFGYFVVFPAGFRYFVEVLSGTDIQFLPLMKDYFSFAFQMLTAFGVIFETPLAVFYLAISGLVSLKALFAFQKYFIILAFVIAAILTPPDIVSQILMGVPIVALYELSLGLAWLTLRRRNKKTLASNPA